MNPMLKLAYVTSHPIQYQAGLFRTLAARPDVDFKVFFGSNMGVNAYFDSGFGRELKWDVPLLEGYAHTFVPNITRKQTLHGFFDLVNPTMGTELIRWGADVVIVHGYAYSTMHIVMAHCRVAGIPVLMRGESNLLPKRTLAIRAAKSVAALGLRSVLAGAVAIGTLNAHYWRSYGLPEDTIFLAPYSVDNAYFASRADTARERAATWRQELHLTPETRVVGYAAKLSKVKDCATLIRAFGEAAVPDTALVIAGDGTLRAELEALAASFPLAKIHFLGFLNQSDMPAAYAISDLFVLPSNFEPWGLVINEAMNLGCPVAVSEAVGCAPDLVGPDNGWVFPVGDTTRLRDILREALSGPNSKSRLTKMGAASRHRIAHWSFAETAQGFIAAANAVKR